MRPPFNPYPYILIICGTITTVVGIVVFMAGRNTTNMAAAEVLSSGESVLNGLVDQQFGIAILAVGLIALTAATVILGLQWRP